MTIFVRPTATFPVAQHSITVDLPAAIIITLPDQHLPFIDVRQVYRLSQIIIIIIAMTMFIVLSS